MIRRYTFTVQIDEQPDEHDEHRMRLEMLATLGGWLKAMEYATPRITVTSELKDVQAVPV